MVPIQLKKKEVLEATKWSRLPPQALEEFPSWEKSTLMTSEEETFEDVVDDWMG